MLDTIDRWAHENRVSRSAAAEYALQSFFADALEQAG